MKRIVINLALACMIAYVGLHEAQAGEPEALRYLDYEGDLNRTIAIALTLEDGLPGSPLRGYYFYKKHLKEIPLAGEYTGERSLLLREHGDDGSLTGVFRLRFEDRDPRGGFGDSRLDKEVLTGEWVSADVKRRFSVYLSLTGVTKQRAGEGRYAVAGAEDDALVERNAQAFYRAVMSGDRETAVRHVAYPVTYYRNGRRAMAATEAELLRDYDAIFTEDFIARIGQGTPRRMFANARGIMFAGGAVWLNEEGKAVAFNNAPP